jgi:hypothetical protein
MNRVCELVAARRKAGVRYDIIVVSEGAKIAGQDEVYSVIKKDGFGHKVLGGIGRHVALEAENAPAWKPATWCSATSSVAGSRRPRTG